MKTKLLGGALLAAALLLSDNIRAQESQAPALNILLITADDLNFSSAGFRGSAVANITPNLDRLSQQGMIFRHAHVNCAVSQPSRAVLATGMYAHRNGVEGFYHTQADIPTLMSVLRDRGYMTGIAGKVPHSTPVESFKWDRAVDQPELGQGRDPQQYAQVLRSFLRDAKQGRKPFYFMLNSHDPHRPFHGSEADERMRSQGIPYPPPSRIYTPEEIEVPGFLPDIPDVRTELAQYFSSVRRLDDTVGAALRVLDEEGLSESTLVMFLSDNGISAPFAKTNCYMNSTRTPWIVRWPGVVQAGSDNESDFISAVDFMPTVLEACGIDIPPNVDGRSFMPLLRGEAQANRSQVFTQFYETSARNRYPMFAVQDAKYLYIYNAWSDGQYRFLNDSQGGIAFKGMVKAAETSPQIHDRVQMLWYRQPEELYALETDPDATRNLVADPSRKQALEQYRQSLANWMEQYGSSALESYKRFVDYSQSRSQYMDAQRKR
ncbi:MAG: sulfatase [Tannerellaceae bacterium]|nr:sulfatase [Tannerellaceae bacterium]